MDEIRKAYRKGYQAGHERGKAKANEQHQYYAEERSDRFFCAALTGLLATSKEWRHGEKKYSDVPGYVKLALCFTKEAIKQTRVAK